MKIQSSLLRPALVVAIALFAMRAHAAEPAEMPKPIELDSKEVAAFVAIPHADTFIQNIEALGNKFSPAPMKPGTMKTQFGTGIGDPELAAFDFSKPVVVMVLKGPPTLPPLPAAPPPVAFFIPVKNPEPYKNALTAIAKLQVDVKDNVVIASEKPEYVEKAVAQKALYDKIAAAGIKGDVRAYVSIAQMMETYGRQVDSSLDEMSKTVAMLQLNPAGAPGIDAKSLGTIMKVYVKSIAGMLKQSQAAQIDMVFKDDSVQQDLLFIAKPDSTVAKFFAGAPPGENKLLPLMKSGGVMSMAMRTDPAAMKAAMEAILPEIEKDPQLKEVFDDKLVGMMKEAIQGLGSDMVMAMLPVEKGFPLTRTAMAVTDEKKYMDMLERSMALLAPDSLIGKLYASMGMSMLLEKNVREHAGISISRMKFKLDAGKLQPAQAAQMTAMLRDTELAIFKGTYLTATEPADLDAMIDQVLAGLPPKAGDVPPLKAMATFGPKQQLYVDYDFAALMKATMAADANNPMAAAFKDVKGGEPIQLAGRMGDGKLFLRAHTPLAPFVQMAKTMQQMMGPGVKPPPPPPDKPPGPF